LKKIEEFRGPGSYDPAYKEIGQAYRTVSGHVQHKVSPQFAPLSKVQLRTNFKRDIKALIEDKQENLVPGPWSYNTNAHTIQNRQAARIKGKIISKLKSTSKDLRPVSQPHFGEKVFHEAIISALPPKATHYRSNQRLIG